MKHRRLMCQHWYVQDTVACGAFDVLTHYATSLQLNNQTEKLAVNLHRMAISDFGSCFQCYVAPFPLEVEIQERIG